MKKCWNIILLFLFFFFSFELVNAETIGVVGDDVAAYCGSGTVDDPFHYLFDFDSKVTWKHLGDIKAKDYTEIYEKREGNSSEGMLLYSWTFSKDMITNPEGPYFLGISFYKGDIVDTLAGATEAKYFSFANKRDLPGTSTITMYVGDQFDDNTKLELYYYGGYNSEVLHGSTPVIDEKEIQEQDDLKNLVKGLSVQGGYVQFDIRYGGNYFLTEGLLKQSSPVNDIFLGDTITKDTVTKDTVSKDTFTKDTITKGTVTETTLTEDATKENSELSIDSATQEDLLTEKSDIKTQEVIQGTATELKENHASEKGRNDIVYTEELSMGKICELFPTTNIAFAIAASLSKNVEDDITQADINSIKKLYLSGNEIETIDELGQVEFARLERLDLSNNKIKSIPSLKMPMLQSIDFSNNEITNISNLTENKELEIILLQNNKIEEIFQISEFIKLTSLNLSNNLIVTLPDLKSSSLKYLNLSNNEIKLINNMNGIPNLEFLDISGNQIKKLPDYDACKNLTELVTDHYKDNKYRTSYFVILIIFIAFASVVGIKVFSNNSKIALQ